MSDTLPVVVGMCQGQVGQKAGPVPHDMQEAFRKCFLQNGVSSSTLAEPPWTCHEKTKRDGPREGVLSWGVRGDERGCLACAVRPKGTAGCRFTLTAAPRNPRVDVGSPASGLGPVSQHCLCRPSSLLGTREEHIASFYKCPGYKRIPAPSGGPGLQATFSLPWCGLNTAPASNTAAHLAGLRKLMFILSPFYKRFLLLL